MTKMADTATAIGSSIARLSARDGKNPASIGVGEVAADISASVHATAATQGRQAPGAPQSGGGSTLGQAAAKIAQEAGVFIQQLKALPTADQVGVEAAHKRPSSFSVCRAPAPNGCRDFCPMAIGAVATMKSCTCGPRTISCPGSNSLTREP